MGWTQPTAIFFAVIASLLIAMSLWEFIVPGGGPRVGILRFETTRGDRLFISLLGAAFICLAWLLFTDLNLWWGVAVSCLYALVVFLVV